MNRKTGNKYVVFENVSIIPMDREIILENKTLIIKNGTITDIFDTNSSNIPDKGTTINGNGKYLLPGLSDMHVHITSKKDLFLFLAHGVTTVQNMWGQSGFTRILGIPDHLKLRDRIERDDVIGPRIFTAGPVLEGKPREQPFMQEITSIEAARRSVIDQKKAGYDFIKVYDNLTAEIYDVILNTAKKVGLPVKGHVPRSVGIDRVLESSQISIEHLTGYIDPDLAGFVTEEEMIDQLARKTARSGTWNCPTIVIWQKRVSLDDFDEMAKHPGMKHLSRFQTLFLRKSFTELNKSIKYTGENYTKRMADICYKMTRSLHTAGAKLLLGTDAGNPFVFPGFSVHEELQYLVNAGLTPYEALKTGTVNAAASLNKLDEFGTITVGKRADLVLVDNNPLEDIGNAKEITGTVVKGSWIPKSHLERMLESGKKWII